MRAPMVPLVVVALLVAGSWACVSAPSSAVPTAGGDRQRAVPAGAVKQTMNSDAYPPRLHSAEFAEPVPMAGPVNTAGLEDSPFFAPDGRFYFFFTPSAAMPAEKQ